MRWEQTEQKVRERERETANIRLKEEEKKEWLC